MALVPPYTGAETYFRQAHPFPPETPIVELEGQWDLKHNVSVSSLADGLEETAVLGLISPHSGPPLVSAVGDIGGACILSRRTLRTA